MKVFEGGIVAVCGVCGGTRVHYPNPWVYLSDGSWSRHDDVLCRCERKKSKEARKQSMPFYVWRYDGDDDKDT